MQVDQMGGKGPTGLRAKVLLVRRGQPRGEAKASSKLGRELQNPFSLPETLGK